MMSRSLPGGGGLAAGEVGDLRGETSWEDVFVDLLGARDWGQGALEWLGSHSVSAHPAPQQSPARNRVDAAPTGFRRGRGRRWAVAVLGFALLAALRSDRSRPATRASCCLPSSPLAG